MSEIVERVAEAIWDARIAKGGPGRTLMPWPFCPEAEWCRDTARAAITAYESYVDEPVAPELATKIRAATDAAITSDAVVEAVRRSNAILANL